MQNEVGQKWKKKRIDRLCRVDLTPDHATPDTPHPSIHSPAFISNMPSLNVLS
jgi:hypothetical protein